MKKEKSLFSILNQKRVVAVRTLQEQCAFPSDRDFINALECNSIEEVYFGTRDVNKANEIYDYSKGATMGKFKHPHKRVNMDRTTKDVATPVLSTIMEHFKDIHLDIDILFVSKIPILLAKSRDI